ncbi:MAG TPA: DUF503 domain-containing protein [Deferrisomatales bacterium]|nr:DUF503 domain-containing protein [Deferrisomatales bacterium]
MIGAATVEMYLHGVHSLKEKRSILRRILERTRHQFPVSAAEVDHQDQHQQVTIGLAVVSGDARVANSILDKALDFIENLHLAEIVRTDLEILHL